MSQVPSAGRSAYSYQTVADATGTAGQFWTLPAGTWQVLTAKTQLVTDTTAGNRLVSFQIIGPDGFEIYECQVTPSGGIGPSFHSFCFGAVGGAQLNYTPTFNFTLPALTVAQDSSGLWAAGFHNSGVVGAGDVWQGTRLYVVR